MNVKLLTEHHLEFLSLKGGCIGLSESTLVKIPHCWKSHVTAQLSFTEYILIETRDTELLHVFARYTPSLALIRIPVDYSTALSGILIQDKTTGFTIFLLACTENGKINSYLSSIMHVYVCMVANRAACLCCLVSQIKNKIVSIKVFRMFKYNSPLFELNANSVTILCKKIDLLLRSAP